MFDCCYSINSTASGLNIPLATWQMLMHEKLCLIPILKVHKSQIFGNNFFNILIYMQHASEMMQMNGDIHREVRVCCRVRD